MLDDLGIKGIKPVNDRPDRQPQNRGGDKNFSLDEEPESHKKRPEKKKQPPRRRKKEEEPPERHPGDEGIDIIL